MLHSFPTRRSSDLEPHIPVLQGTFIIFSASVIVMNLLADVLYRFLDPRVRVR